MLVTILVHLPTRLASIIYQVQTSLFSRRRDSSLPRVIRATLSEKTCRVIESELNPISNLHILPTKGAASVEARRSLKLTRHDD
ncbi:hypothetical protein E4T56_gene7403 [Termitomyces sp. T112]|nr:hypothetical protein E4T56_gene7403 [Termitomyces sp. T112]